jgi:hypothetical protein
MTISIKDWAQGGGLSDLRGREKKKHNNPEKQIQNSILQALSIAGYFAWPVQNQGQYDPARKTYRRPPKWFRYGVPDIIVAARNGITLFIEVKSPVGDQSKAQRIFEAEVFRRGHRYTIARSVSDVFDYMRIQGILS